MLRVKFAHVHAYRLVLIIKITCRIKINANDKDFVNNVIPSNCTTPWLLPLKDMPGRKKPSALQRVKELCTKNDLWSGEHEVTSEDAPRAGEKPLETKSDLDLPPSLHCQEHLIPSAASTSDEQATVDNDADEENTCQQVTGGEAKDQVDASIPDNSVNNECRPDHSEAALEP